MNQSIHQSTHGYNLRRFHHKMMLAVVLNSVPSNPPPLIHNTIDRSHRSFIVRASAPRSSRHSQIEYRRIKHKDEIRLLFKVPDLAGEVRGHGLRETGHIFRLEENMVASKIFKIAPKVRDIVSGREDDGIEPRKI